jgi:hypothetical protein
MIDKIKKELGKFYNLDESKGIFMSCFDKENNLILSNGVIVTDKKLNKVIDMIYHGLIEKQVNSIARIVCDIVLSIESKHTLEEINIINLSIQ